METLLVPMGNEKLEDNSALRGHGDAGCDVILERRVIVGRGPIGDVAVSSAAIDSVVVANVADQSVSIFDPAARPVGDTVAVAGESVAVIVTDDRAYVAHSSANHDAVSAIDLETRAIVATFPMDFSVTALAASPDGKRVYAGLRAHDRVAVTVIDTVAEKVRTIDIGYGPAASLDALYVDPSGKRLYAAVTDDSGSRLVIVNRKTSKVQRVVVVGSPIRDIAHASGAIYVLTSDRTVGGAVHVIDLSTNRVTDTLIIGGAPTQLVMSPDQARAYVVDYDRVAVLCTLSLEIVDSLFLDERPSCVALGSDGSSLYVADYSGGVYKFSVDSTMEKLYSDLLATDPGSLNVPRVLEPVNA